MTAIAGVILAGGKATRMGGADKALMPLGRATLLDHVIERLGPQCSHLALSANGDPVRFARFGLPVLADPLPDFPGPLAGVLAGLDWAAGVGVGSVVTAAADTPFLPRDLVGRLYETSRERPGTIALAASSGDAGTLRRHPTFALWPVALRGDLRAALSAGMRKVTLWADRHGTSTVSFPSEPFDPFFNVNTREDLLRAEVLLDPKTC